MVSRIPPPEDGGTERRPRSTGLVAILLVLAVAVGLWFLNGGDDGGTSVATDDTSASAPSSGGQTTLVEVEPEDAESATPVEPSATDPDSGLPTVYLLDLPPEAAETVEAIERGPPFAYEKDGSTFGNYEGLLPDAERGYYREFTVETPGSYDRGARRIVEGASGELYWTDDHYASFSRILL